MKLISLNIWGGRIHEPFINFIKNQKENTDIFCFQEVFHHGKVVPAHEESKMEIFSEIKDILNTSDGFLAPRNSQEELLSIFAKKEINLEKENYITILGEKNGARESGIILQYAQFQKENRRYTIANFHGYWTPNFKNDTPERIKQSNKILEFFDAIEGPKIICGDFNLDLETESVKILEKKIRNLIREYGITSTRTHHYTKQWKFADYCFVSPEVEVKNFKVLQDTVSDHLPLVLEFN